MRLPRPRLTVRMLMGLVALAAMILGGMRAREHYVRCLVIARSYDAESRALEKSLATASASYKTRSIACDRLFKQVKSKREVESRIGARSLAIRDYLMNRQLPPVVYEEWDLENFDSVRETERFLEAEAEKLKQQARDIATKRGLLAYVGRLKGRYESAAYRPWEGLPIGPPPSDPELATDFWLKRRDYARALDESREAIDVDPENPEAHNVRAWILATCPDPRFRNGSLAVREATRACELSKWQSFSHLDTLAASHAASDDFARAIEWEGKAIRIVSAGSPEKGAMTSRLDLYRAGKPYRDVP